jgi:hypothetical protein
MDDHTAQSHTALFPDLSPDCLLDRLAWFLKPCESAVPELGPSSLSSQEDPGPVGTDDRHDHCRICPREAQVRDSAARGTRLALLGLGLAAGTRLIGRRTHPLGPRVDRERGLAALGTEWIPGVPV